MQLVHPLGRLLSSACPDTLKNLALKILCHLIYHIGSEYAIFIPVIVCLILFPFLCYILTFISVVQLPIKHRLILVCMISLLKTS